MSEARLKLWDDCGATYETTLEEGYTHEDIETEAREWIEEGSWGEDGAVVNCHFAVLNFLGERIDHGNIQVEVPPDHEALIRYATRRTPRHLFCGYSPDDHDWTREGEGGCSQNPGVWSTGGTGLVIRSHCRDCGLQREEHIVGSQRNPGEHDTVVYGMPDRWCIDCQSDGCECE